MDDLAKKISDLLNSPEGMQKLQAAAASFGIGGNAASEEKNEPSVPAGASIPSSSSDFASGLGDMEMIQKLLPLLSNVKSDDKDTILLKALRPYLQDQRQQRLDETVKMMRLLKILPLIKDKGGL